MIAQSQSSRVRTPALWIAQVWNDTAVRTSLLVFLAFRILTLVVALLMVRDVPDGRPPLLNWNPETQIGNPSGETYESSLPPDSPLANLMNPWRRYDTAWYIRNAMLGYSPNTSIAFPPLYSIMIRAAAPFTGGNWVLASVLVSNAFCLAAFIMLFKLIQRLFGDDGLATRALILLSAFPTGFYLYTGYTEPIFLAFTLGAFLSALDRRWWLAAVLAFLAALTRLQGAVLCLPLAWIAYRQLREQGLWRSPGALLSRAAALAAAPLGTLSFLAYLQINNLGSLDEAFAIGWKLSSEMPWVAIAKFFERWQQRIVPEHEFNNAFILLVMILLSVVVTFRFKREYAIYVWSTLFVIMLRYHFGEDLEGAQFESVFRYVLLLFPCFVVLAMLLRRRWMMLLYLLVCLQWQLYLLDHFIHWRWVA
jgi:hypothetical protein